MTQICEGVRRFTAKQGRPVNLALPPLSYLTLAIDQILDAIPAGTMPSVEEVTLRSKEEMAPYLLEPGSPGWKAVYGLANRRFGS